MRYSLKEARGYPGGASGKEPAHQCRRSKRPRYYSWVGKIPWRRKWRPPAVFLPGESHGQRGLAAIVYGVAESDTNEHTHYCHV